MNDVKDLQGQSIAIKAIEFALTIDDHYEVREFLDGWLHGDTSKWPEFAATSGNQANEQLGEK